MRAPGSSELFERPDNVFGNDTGLIELLHNDFGDGLSNCKLQQFQQPKGTESVMAWNNRTAQWKQNAGDFDSNSIRYFEVEFDAFKPFEPLSGCLIALTQFGSM